jgi:hypothetical protein
MSRQRLTSGYRAHSAFRMSSPTAIMAVIALAAGVPAIAGVTEWQSAVDAEIAVFHPILLISWINCVVS